MAPQVIPGNCCFSPAGLTLLSIGAAGSQNKNSKSRKNTELELESQGLRRPLPISKCLSTSKCVSISKRDFSITKSLRSSAYCSGAIGPPSSISIPLAASGLGKSDSAIATAARASSDARSRSRQAVKENRGEVEEVMADEDEVPEENVDVVVIGAGIGGLCCAGLLAKYGYKVLVLESHDAAGGAGHSFFKKGFQFDSGPSFHAGLSTKPSINPLKQVLDALDEEVKCFQYKNWVGYLPEGVFNFTADKQAYTDMIRRAGGARAAQEWTELETRIAPMAKAAMGLPAAALRSDLAVVLTAAKFLPQLLPYVPYTKDLLAPFSKIVNQTVTDPFLRRLIDLECFVLSGLIADSTITAEMVTMFTERHREGGTIDYPVGGGGAIIDALVRGLTKFGGRLGLKSHVESILMENGRAVGVTVKSKKPGTGRGRDSSNQRRTVRAKKAVISNASIWDTAKLLEGTSKSPFSERAAKTAKTESFVHLHLGIDAQGLPADLECHHLIVNDWSRGVGAPQNVCLASIPSIFDPSLAPEGHHVIHAYTAGNEPYEIWKGLDRKSPEYAQLKEERSQCLWEALEKVIPDIRDRVKLKLVGTPLTHERYLRRSEGTYGPAIKAGKESWPGPFTEIPGLLVCGDSTMPGIGVPAVAASGMIAANSLVPFWKQWELTSKIEVVI